jgi:3-deoxy-D-manno-octulosonate 8-phosphate phosphatase (KDO 8-P phosphatase)
MTLKDRLRPIELLVLDVDGVLTAGGIVYGSGENGELELKQFHVRDGAGLRIWHDAGKRTAILTGRNAPLVDRRARELGIDHVIQGARDKEAGYEQLLATTGSSPERIAYLGDDLPDLPVLRRCGLAAAPADACPDVLLHAHLVTLAAGGCGAVRELIERILRCQGRWPC